MVLDWRDSSVDKVFVLQTGGPDLSSWHLYRKPGMIVPLCNPSFRGRDRGREVHCAHWPDSLAY